MEQRKHSSYMIWNAILVSMNVTIDGQPSVHIMHRGLAVISRNLIPNFTSSALFHPMRGTHPNLATTLPVVWCISKWFVSERDELVSLVMQCWTKQLSLNKEWYSTHVNLLPYIPVISLAFSSLTTNVHVICSPLLSCICIINTCIKLFSLMELKKMKTTMWEELSTRRSAFFSISVVTGGEMKFAFL